MTRTWAAAAGLCAALACCGEVNINVSHESKRPGGEPGDAVRPAPADVRQLMNDVSPERLRTLVDRLAGFGTRHTLSDTESETRGIGAARRWMRSEFAAYAAASGRTGDEALQPRFDTHHQTAEGRFTRDVDIVNVMAVLPGSMPEAAARHYYVIAHYDTRASDPLDHESDAPGANDDGSGTAALMELACVMSKRRYDATLVFMAVAGEEQGLYGSRLHARAAKANDVDIRAVLSNDMIGDPSPLEIDGPTTGGRVRVFSMGVAPTLSGLALQEVAKLGSESDSRSRQIARYVAEVAALHGTTVRPQLVFRNDRFLRGGDHKAFVEQGFPGVRFTDAVEKYHRQHQDLREEDGVRYGDTPDHVDEHYLADVTRLNAAVLAHLANAPSAPRNARIVAAELTNDTTLRWSASPEPDVAGYEVVWRETTSPTWDHARDVGATTEATIDLSKDDWLFGVRAYDTDGYRSPVAFPRASRD